MSTGAPTIVQIILFTHLWANCHIHAKKIHLFNKNKSHFMSTFLHQSHCFCSNCWLAHLTVVSRPIHKFVFSPDPSQIYCSILHSSASQSQACSSTSERHTLKLNEWTLCEIIVCTCYGSVKPGVKYPYQISVECRSQVPDLFINKASAVCEDRAWGVWRQGTLCTPVFSIDF